MRFKKLTIRNYRGVDEETVNFADTGITLVHGPNEAGKSSLAEAITTLFKHKDSTTKVATIKPVDKDAGPSVELEASTGQYHFTYAKQFLKQKSTYLTLHLPSVENLTGSQAHERVEAILKETLRKDLWDALFNQKKKDVDLLQAEGKAALMHSLDNAAGGDAGDDPSEGIYERVTEYYHRFFYKTHRENGDISGARTRLEQASAEVARLEEALGTLNAKADRSAALRGERAGVASDLAAARKNREEKRRVVAELESLKRAATDDRNSLTTATAETAVAAAGWRERTRLVEAANKAVNDVLSLSAPVDDDSLTALETTATAAAEKLRTAEGAKKRADEVMALAQRDCDYHRDVTALTELKAADVRLQAARHEVDAAQAELSTNPVTGQVMRALRSAGAEVTRLESLLTRDAPRVVLTGLQDVEATVDGETIRLGEAEQREYSVADTFAVTLANALRVEVRSGSVIEKERKNLDDATERLRNLLNDAGCGSVEDAEERAERRSKAESARADAQRRIANETPEAELRHRIERLEEALARYIEARGDLAPLPENLDAAIQARSHADSAVLSAEEALTAARTGETTARQRLDAALTARRDAALRRELAEERAKAAQGELDRAREGAPDAAIEAALAAATQAAAEAKEKAEASEKAWQSRNPDAEAAQLASLEQSVGELERVLRDIELEQQSLAGELRALGEAGLYETLEAAKVEKADAALALEALLAKANAARMLYETMTEAREQTRQNYQRPLKAMLEELGRDVFGEDFQVAINDALAIESRTVGGKTVPYDSLSGGAKEQLTLLYRAACAILVSEKEGMPLILDDVLGHSDVNRLELVGKALETAAERCQIIIFTCMPDRYAGLRNATTVALA